MSDSENLENFEEPTEDFGPYIVVGSGVNAQGNFFCSHHYLDRGLARPDTYHYINANGSTYFLYPNNSTRYDSGKGLIRYDDGNGGGYTEKNGKRIYK